MGWLPQVKYQPFAETKGPYLLIYIRTKNAKLEPFYTNLGNSTYTDFKYQRQNLLHKRLCVLGTQSGKSPT
jgi:hypothetical protein